MQRNKLKLKDMEDDEIPEERSAEIDSSLEERIKPADGDQNGKDPYYNLRKGLRPDLHKKLYPNV